MRFQLTIAKKGLFLIAIPLVVEIAFVLWLWFLFCHVSEQRKDIANSREFVAEVMDLTRDLLDGGICLGAWKSTKSDVFIKQFDAIIASLPSVYKKLEEISAGDRRRQNHVEALKVTGKQILELTSGFRKPSGIAMLALMDPVDYRNRLSNAYQGFMLETSAIAREERERQNLNPAQEEHAQSTIAWALIIGVIVNVTIAAMLLNLFSQSITFRLAVLTDNCLRFAARKQLNQPVAGGDEIADLDVHIHAMATAVRSAEQKRDQYMQMINHDVRAPLAAIQTVLASTLRGLYGELTDKGRSRIADAGEDSTRVLQLINESMEVDRLESAQFQLNRARFNLADLIEGAITSLRPLMEQKQIAMDYFAQEAQVFADQPRLLRVVTNLIDNAIKYSPAGSTIHITVDASQAEKMVQVKDEGPGIKVGDAERLFQAYERGEDLAIPQDTGKGLGLAICKAIVEAHGGRIGVKAAAGHGSIFWFAIPSS